jgi:Fur family ferric uptake transcriptional regulator
VPPFAERRLTHKQRAILQATQRLTVFASSQRIHGELASAGIAVGLSTVYRTLHRLAERGHIDSIVSPSGEAWYRGCPSTEEHPHHHLVCRVCGLAIEIESETVTEWVERVESEHDFRAVERTVQLSGVCHSCEEAAVTA